VAGVLGAIAVAVLGGLWASAHRAMGAAAEGARLERMQASPQWRANERRFGNVRERIDGSGWEMAQRWFFGGSDHASPETPLPVVQRRGSEFEATPASGLRVTWFGHSILLVELDGRRILIDPVFGERASPLTFLGPKRWYAPPLPLEELPPLDAVVISHDHYDHLDLFTVEALAPKRLRWIVPLGVGAHLESWGIEPERITELDWWQETKVEELTVTATPARHFSGRSLGDQYKTLWAGYALRGPQHNVYYSGDTALFDELVDIGSRLGPFDVTLIESGAYNQLWADVHLGPEQAVRAHRLVRGDVFVPVHWGLFDLALHGWTEPIERVFVAAQREGIRFASPRPGESIEPASLPKPTRWWPEVPWQSAEESPALSSGVEHLMADPLPQR
jgi:L-ascorbate metabolism protein UlaG (beta-lactamase superfamily)